MSWADEKLWIALGCLVYLVALGVALSDVFRGRRYSKALMPCLLAGGWLLQLLGLYLRGLERGACPLGNLFEIAQFISWSAVLLYFIIYPVYRLNLLGLFVSGIAALVSGIALLIPGWDRPYLEPLFGGNPWIEVHASLAIFSYGIFGVLAGTSLMYLLQQWGLKRRKAQGVFRFLPPIVDLDVISQQLLLAGLAVLSTSLFVGSMHWIPYPDSMKVLKLFTTVLLWFAYLNCLVFRLRHVLVGSLFAWVNLFLFIAALFTLWPVDKSRKADDAPEAMTAQVASQTVFARND